MSRMLLGQYCRTAVLDLGLEYNCTSVVNCTGVLPVSCEACYCNPLVLRSTGVVDVHSVVKIHMDMHGEDLSSF